MATTRDIKEEIRSRISLADLVSKYVQLKRSGSRLVGLCPFHDEDSPSFSVDPEKGLYHCFGCKAGGDAFTFVMETEGLSFREAVSQLANVAGVSLPEGFSENNEQKRKHPDLEEVNGLALELFTRGLQGKLGQRARKYLAYRGVKQDTVNRFKLGYAPDGWQSLTSVLTKKEHLEAGVRAGLIVSKENGHHFDFFRDRLMFPIMDNAGQTIAFGGRMLGEGRPKYLNSPETPLFVKRQQLYGMHQAKESIRRTRRAILVEGFMDCISLHQAGVNNTVATCGTALSLEHVKQLLRFAEELYVCFDADTAGIAGVKKGLQALEQVDATVRVVPLPEGEDPDSFVRRAGKAGFLGQMERSVPIKDFLLEEALRGSDLKSTQGRLQAAKAIIPMLRRMRNRVEQDLYIQRMANRLNVPAPSLTAEVTGEEPKSNVVRHTIRENRNTSRDFVQVPRRRKTTRPRDMAERELLRCLLDDPSGLEQVKRFLGGAPFGRDTYNAVFRSLASGLSGAEALQHLNEADKVETEAELLHQSRGELTWRICLQKLALLQMREELGAMEEGLARLVDNDPVQYLTQITNSLLAFKRWRQMVKERLALGMEAY